MPLFDRVGKPAEQKNEQVTPDMMRREIGSIRANPGAYLGQRGFRIPEGMTDPKEITTHLLKTGQVGSSRLSQVMQMIGAPMK